MCHVLRAQQTDGEDGVGWRGSVGRLPTLRLLGDVVLLGFATAAPPSVVSQDRAVVDCVNAGGTLRAPQEGSGWKSVAELMDDGDINNLCTAEGHFCGVSATRSWMFTWYLNLR